MNSPRPTRRRRRLLAGLLPLLLAAAVLPLMAPTCGNMAPGIKTFSRFSLIIPMDLCYQSMNDGLSGSGGYPAVGCPQGKAAGDTVKAYGLVYHLIRKGIPVYWIIAENKTQVTDVDMRIQYNGGPPVLKLNWAHVPPEASTTAPTSGSTIEYRGGPFVIDGSDFLAAVQEMDQFRNTFSGVNVHVANVAFQARVAKTMAGGWSAGGNVAPKLALLDIGSDAAIGGAENAEVVIQAYLRLAGLDSANAGGSSAPGAHGQIYDRLTMDDFTPSTAGDWTTTRLYQNGYQILWVPHWSATSSCSDCSTTYCPCRNHYSAATNQAALATIGAFVAAGKDLFAECAGIGSFEGVYASAYPSTGTLDPAYNRGHPSTHFQTGPTAGLWINAWGGNTTSDRATLVGGFASPMMQIGDYPFATTYGALDDFRPNNDAYLGGVQVFISSTSYPTYDVFTYLAASGTPGQPGAHGNVVYLAGHSYSERNPVGAFEVAGTRLVLNTLFNLGAGCVETGVSCNTGQLGECAKGNMSCGPDGPYCKPANQSQPEVCDGLDNDCNGLVDDGTDRACYDGPSGTQDVGVCHGGVEICTRQADGLSYGYSACIGQVTPSAEVCNGLDDACTGHPDEIQVFVTTPAPGHWEWQDLQMACYTGSDGSLDPGTGQPRGVCKAGYATCTGGVYGACPLCPATAWQNKDDPAYKACEILPQASQDCSDPNWSKLDMLCIGAPNCACTDGDTVPCYYGPSGTSGVGVCTAGARRCNYGQWGQCNGQRLPGERDCTSDLDNDCNGDHGDKNDPACQWTCPPDGDPSLVCPITNSCPGTNADDTSCTIAWIHNKGGVGEAACPAAPGTCPSGTRCVEDPPGVKLCKTVCTPGTPGCEPAGECLNGSRDCANGMLGECTTGMLAAPEICDGKDNNCNGSVDEHPETLCGAGFTCTDGVCIQSSCGVEHLCPEGWDCDYPAPGAEYGTCVRAACGTETCSTGETCQYQTCENPCPDGDSGCGEGAVCSSSGSCTGGGCYLLGCPSGQVCQQGTCEPDPCSGVTCPTGTFCRAGDCVQSCVYVNCPSGQVCDADGFCQADLCPPEKCSNPTDMCDAKGDCVPNACSGKACGPRQVCQAIEGKAVCADDPCTLVHCPVGACSNGQCYPVTQHDHSSASTSSSDGKGCGCGQGSAGSLSALLFLLLVPLARRRRVAASAAGRGGRGALLVLAVLGVVAAQGCSGKGGSSSVDLSKCHATCGENQCIDLNYDPGHCGSCDTTCGSGQICMDGACGPSSLVAPFLTALTPNQGNPGNLAPVTVTLSGTRFQDQATVRVISGAGSMTIPACPQPAGVPCTTFVSSSQLTTQIDLSELPATLLELRVVNPDHVISNGRPFSVESVAPYLDGVDPARVTTGTVTHLLVSGRSLSADSQCHVMSKPPSTSLIDTGLPTVTSGTGLDCTFNAQMVPPGTYQLWVMNGASMKSNVLEFLVESGDPELEMLTPSSGLAGALIELSLLGSGFDPTSIVECSTCGRTYTPEFIDGGRLVVSPFTVPASSASITVRNGNGVVSGAQVFQVVASAQRADRLTLTPPSPYQGQTLTLLFDGIFANSGTGAGITIVPPSGTAPAVTISSRSGTQLQGTASLAGLPPGNYSTYVNFANGTNSGTFQFRVLSNVAVLQSVSPGGAKQGPPDPVVTLSAVNLRPDPGTPGITVLFQGGDGTNVTLTPPATAIHANSIDVTLPLSAPTNPRNTGVYTLQIVNPRAQPSNQASFTVMPGQPTVTRIGSCGTGAAPGACTFATAACVVQGENSVWLRLEGTNFAKYPVSQVMFRSPEVGSTWQPVPASITVDSSTQITAHFDTRNAVSGTTYGVAVWNAPGPMASAEVRTLKVGTCP